MAEGAARTRCTLIDGRGPLTPIETPVWADNSRSESASDPARMLIDRACACAAVVRANELLAARLQAQRAVHDLDLQGKNLGEGLSGRLTMINRDHSAEWLVGKLGSHRHPFVRIS